MISGTTKGILAVLLTVAFSFLRLPLSAQDKEVEARVHYNNGEEAFNNKEYNKCFLELSKAETILGTTNPKILYLKIKVLNTTYKDNYPFIYTLKKSIERFFEMADSKTYPQDKYTEIINIKDELAAFKETLGPSYASFWDNDYIGHSPNVRKDVIVALHDRAIKANVFAGDDLHREVIRFEKPICRIGGKYFYAFSFTPAVEGYFYWCWVRLSGDFEQWYLLDKRGSADTTTYFGSFKSVYYKPAKLPSTRFEFSYHAPSSEYFSTDTTKKIFLQRSDALLHPGTEYYLWLSTSSQEPLSLILSLNLSKSDLSAEKFFSEEKFKKIGLYKTVYYNEEYYYEKK